jgi:hypothetical protein
LQAQINSEIANLIKKSNVSIKPSLNRSNISPKQSVVVGSGESNHDKTPVSGVHKASRITLQTVSQRSSSISQVPTQILGESEHLKDFSIKAWFKKLAKKKEDIQPKYLMNE